jgi:ATP-dependent helicase/nuclease subunit A
MLRRWKTMMIRRRRWRLADLFVVGDAVTRVADEERRPPDWQERERALDIRQSWIVEAPAGSGKTGLLIQRYLKLLAEESVTEPEQVLAITFTVKATAEIRERVVEQLEGALNQTALKRGDAFERETRVLAEAVLERDRLGSWGLLENPLRLNMRTIDSVCGQIASSLPVLSGGGGQQKPVPDAARLYRAAARRTLMLLGGEDAALSDALRTVLLHRDGNLAECEKLLAGMLELRDQWGELIPLQRRELDDVYLEEAVRPRLQRALELAISAGLTRLAESLPVGFLREISGLAASLANIEPYEREANPLAACVGGGLPGVSGHEALEHWRALIHLMVTPSGGTWRRSFAKNTMGFETTAAEKKQMKAALEQVSHRDDLLVAINRVSKLPPAVYPQEQWDVAKALFRMLSRALVELQLVFAERGECDFAEVGLRAREALRTDGGVSDLALGMKFRHLLVDEMQDTSTSQYELIERLTQSWDGQSQTVFLVGDPKQSIYIFRQARVERFLRTMREERLGELEIGCLRLTANFRSQGALVDEFNADFSRLFPAEIDASNPDEVPFTAAEAVRGASESVRGAVWHLNVLPAALGGEEKAREKRRLKIEEAETVRKIVQEWRARARPAGRTEPWKIAVLVRGRGHLADIVAALKRDDGDGAVPFRAVNIEALGERQEVLDLTALTRALLHPADRVAWLAVLRAPWCGLGLADLHKLAGGDEPKYAERCIDELMAERGHLLSDDGCARLERFWLVMQEAAKRRGRLTAAQWVERTWRSLGGDAYLTAAEMGNARRYFQLLDEIEAEGEAVDMAVLGQRLDKLYAEAAAIEGAVDLMTIHGAKGLEWDVVLVPGMERKAPTPRSHLLTWNEFDQGDDETAAQVVLAPIVGKGKSAQALNTWLKAIHDAREAAERKRLFYVVCTRAREELHLFASPTLNQNGGVSRTAGSLLAAAWPAAQERFAGAGSTRPEESNVISMPSRDESFAGDIAAASGEIVRPATVQRLPLGFDARARFVAGTKLPYGEPGGDVAMAHFERPEGSFAARSFGNAVHGFLELLTNRLAAGVSEEGLLREIEGWVPRIETVLGGDGLPPAMVARLALRVKAALENTLRDEAGRWVLSAQAGAASEYAFTSWQERRRSYRLDRVFRAGAEPGSTGDGCLWVVDYKTTSHGREGVEEFLEREREKYRPQMEAYAQALRADGEEQELRVGLYYPMLPRLMWWRPEPS